MPFGERINGTRCRLFCTQWIGIGNEHNHFGPKIELSLWKTFARGNNGIASDGQVNSVSELLAWEEKDSRLHLMPAEATALLFQLLELKDAVLFSRRLQYESRRKEQMDIRCWARSNISYRDLSREIRGPLRVVGNLSNYLGGAREPRAYRQKGCVRRFLGGFGGFVGDLASGLSFAPQFFCRKPKSTSEYRHYPCSERRNSRADRLNVATYPFPNRCDVERERAIEEGKAFTITLLIGGVIVWLIFLYANSKRPINKKESDESPDKE